LYLQIIRFCWDSNRGSLASEGTDVPSEQGRAVVNELLDSYACGDI